LFILILISTMSKLTCQVFHNIYYSKLNRFVFRNFIHYQVKSKFTSTSYFCYSTCFWYRMFLLQYVFLGSERFFYSMCFWYRTFLLQHVFLVQNVSATVCVSDTELYWYSMCFWYRTFLLQYLFLVQNFTDTACVFGT